MELKFLTSGLLLVVCMLGASCKQEPVDPEPPVVTPPVTPVFVPPTGSAICLSFENFVGNAPLTLDQTLRYENMNGDSFSVELYKYYITNVAFMDNLGNTWFEPNSYHLVDAADTSSIKVYIDSMPSGTYTNVSFMIGVDSTRNVSGTQSGALDPAKGMFWTWSSGYIMAKVEGRSPSSTTSFDLLVFHIGGYAGQFAGQRVATPSFNSDIATVTTTSVPKIHVKSDLNEWFQSPNIIDFSSISNVSTPSAFSVLVADNYANMFSITSIDN